MSECVRLGIIGGADSFNSPDYWPITEEHLHQVTSGHRQQKTRGCSSSGGDRSPVVALEERVRELQALLVLLGKDLRDLDQSGCSCQDQAVQPPSQGQAKSCSWCRTKSKLGIIRREISTRAKKALGIHRKPDRDPAPALDTAALDLPPPNNTTGSPEQPAPAHNPWSIEELPAPSGMFEPPAPVHNPCFMEELSAPSGMSELDDSGAWPPGCFELAVGFESHLQNQMGSPAFASYGTPATRASGSLYTSGSSFSDGFTGGPLRATPGRRFTQGSMVSTSSSSFHGSHSLVTPLSSRSNTNTSNSVPFINTDFRTVVSHDDLYESPTALLPGLGTDAQQEVPHWERNNASHWGSTSTLADDTGNGVNNPFRDSQWKRSTDGMYTAHPGNRFDYPSTRGNENEDRIDTEPHGPPPFTSFGTSQYTGYGSWDKQISELPCPSTPAFPTAPIKARVHPPWESKEVTSTPQAHGIRQRKAARRKPLRSGTRSNLGHLGGGVGGVSWRMSSPRIHHAASAQQPLAQRNAAYVTPPHLHAYPPAVPLVNFQPNRFGGAPEYPSRIQRATGPPRMEYTAKPQPFHPFPAAAAAAASPQLSDQRDPEGGNRQSSLVSARCEPCGKDFKGENPRKLLKRHEKTSAKHRRQVGEAASPRVLCEVCGSDFSALRLDNLMQHVRRVHGGLKLEDCGPVQYELEDEDEMQDEDDVEMSDA